ncbi:MAG: S1 RNA-binding domain-containing protein [Succinivibrio sp.]|nr:S1 RNA-binding domain-containing protein [Succinivibrio sp.]
MEDQVLIGRMIAREVTEITEQGAFVDAGQYGALFVPRSQLPDDLKTGSKLRVFLYQDGGRVLATARHPYLECGMLGLLRVTTVENGTAYLDLGIPKELVVPKSEQKFPMEAGREVIVYITLDDRYRLFGTQRYNRFIADTCDPKSYRRGQRAVVVPIAHTPLGYKVVVDDRVYGLIYLSEKQGELKLGKRYNGYIANVRADGKLDVTMQEPGLDGIAHAAQDILKALYYSDGKLNFSDKSAPEEIEEYLHMSKGRFKKAIGHLYKEHLILIEDAGIMLTAAGREQFLAKHQE